MKLYKAYKEIIIAIIGMIGIILIGMVGFHLLESKPFFESLWLTVITVLTVGYGDSVPVTQEGKIFALIIIPIGIGVVTYALGAAAAVMIEGKFSKTVGRRKMENAIKKLNNHIIICGLGRVGHQVVEQLKREEVAIVVIDKEILNDDNKILENVLYIEGDATEDDILYQAGIEKASGLIAALPVDADNVYVTLTAKGINPAIKVVARTERTVTEEKLRRAGADKVINPSNIGGRRMAMSIIKPISIDYVDTILNSQFEEFRVEEVVILSQSKLRNKTLKEAKIREIYNVNIVAIKRGDKIISNPKAEEQLMSQDSVLVFGTTDQLNKFEIDSKG